MKIAAIFVVAWLLLCPVSRASYVQSGKLDFTTTTSAACAIGTVTSGDMETVVFQINSTVAPTSVTSPQVPSWIQDEAFNSSGSTYIYAYHGRATSSGSETVTVAQSPSALIGIGCAEYSTTTIDQKSANANSTSVTTLVAIEDIVAGATASGGGASVGGSFTTRQNIQFSGTTYFTMADQHVTSTGTYTASPSGSGVIGVTLQSFSGSGGTVTPTQVGAFLPGP